ncbi:MAG: hypothetical protein J0G30_04465 [Actinomycetales bacterium]|nr:hypothetical protein [Actinomycetales bacterium]
MPSPRARARAERRRPALFVALLGVISALVAPLVAVTPAAADDVLAPVLVQFAKDASPAAPDAASAGETVTFTFTINCSSLDTDCVGATIVDDVPAPLVLQSVSGAGATVPTSLTTSGNHFELAFQEDLDSGGVGLQAGRIVSVSATTTVPADLSADWDGVTITNTGYVHVDNLDSDQQDDAQVVFSVPLVRQAGVTAAVTPDALSAVVGRTAQLAVSARNLSNGSVDELAVQVPQNPGVDVFDAAAITSLDAVLPAGADAVRVDWFDGSWHTGTAAATAALPSGVDPSLIQGLRLVFTGSGAGVARGAEAQVHVGLALRGSVAALTDPTVYHEVAAAWVSEGGVQSSTATSDATLTVSPAAVSPLAQYRIAPSDLVGGDDVTVTLTARNAGDFDLARMTLETPGATGADLSALGLEFVDWVAADVEWPVDAERLEVAYRYADGTGFEAAVATTTRDTVPAPETGRVVVGIRAEFTDTSGAPIGSDQYAVLPFTAHTAAVAADTVTTGTLDLEVETDDGIVATTSASDDLVRRTARVGARAGKIFSPTSVYGVPGATALVSLPSGVLAAPSGPLDTGGSTVGATRLEVSDPAAPGAAPSAFWNMFDASAISATEIPASAVVDIEYWDGTQWQGLAGATGLTGPRFFSLSLSPAQSAAVQGLRFVYTPRTPSVELPPAFSAQPNVKVTLRSQLRDGTGSVTDAIGASDLSLDNTVAAIVDNPSATPASSRDELTRSLTVISLGGGGSGGSGGGSIPMADKAWQQVPANSAVAVKARSGEQATATLSWGTGGIGFDSVVVADPAEDPAITDPADTVFEAFDLVRIAPISSSDDPLLRYDAISAVELYLPGSGWVAASGNPCAGSACDGAFPGYTLSASESAQATGVRLVVVESPTRASRLGSDPNAPSVGSGVAAISAIGRDLDLVFQVRDTRRSDGSAVLGATRGATYNQGSAGVVSNSSRVEGRDASDTVLVSDEAASDILVIDTPLNVSGSKQWLDGPLGTPPAGTPQDLYPTARVRLTAQNSSATRVDSLAIVDPVDGTTPFDAVDLTAIRTITVPSGATSTTVTIDWAAGGSTDYTRAQALALTATDLADAVGITVTHTGRIASGATARVDLDTRLRENLRGTTTRVDGAVSPVLNTADAVVRDPGGTVAPTGGATDNVIVDASSASMTVETLDYGVTAGKRIVAATSSTDTDPAVQYDGDSRQATVTLTAQPDGNVRTNRLVVVDDSASFWNAYDFSGFAGSSLAAPIDRVQVDALVGIDYVIDSGTGAISAECSGDADLTACWVAGTPSSSFALPTLPPGTLISDVRGLRFTFTTASGGVWERPYNPLQSIAFHVDRRTTLIAPAGDPVPSTLYVYPDPAPGETERGVYTDDVQVTASGGEPDAAPLWTATDGASAQILFQHRPARVKVVKSPFGALTLGAPIPYTITVTNTGSGQDRALAEVVVTDTLPVDGSGPILTLPKDPDTGAPADPSTVFSYHLYNASGTEQATPTVTATLAPAGPSGQELTFELAGTLPLGWRLEIDAPLVFRDLLVAGTTALNSVTVTSDQPFDTCDSTTDVTTDNATQTEVASCSSSTRVWPLPSAPMTIVKGVRGDAAGPLDTDGTPLIDPDTGEVYDDLGILKTVTSNPTDCSTPWLTVAGEDYYRYPCVPITRPGGQEEWIAQFTNSGNIPVAQVVAIDVLPTANDQGVIIASSRGSKWTPTLTSYPVVDGLPAGSSYRVYYVDQAGIATPRCNGADIQNEMGMTPTSDPPMVASYQDCLTDTSAPDDLPSRAAAWTLLDPSADAATLASAVALKFVIESPDGLAPGAGIAVRYTSRTAAVPELPETDANLARDSVAYNSIAGAAVGVDGSEDLPYRFVAEPRKVGVALATGSLELAKTVTGAGSSFAGSSFQLALDCTSAGEPIALKHADGSARSPFTVSGDGTVLTVTGIPLYAQCAVSEARDYGQTDSTASSSTLTARAPDSSPSTVYAPHPAFDARPALERDTISNRYGLAGFTVGKTVDNGGAVDQDGTPIVYQSPQFRAVCTFDNGAGATTVLDSGTFTLADGATRDFTGLPAGADCTVTETNRRGAPTTTSVATLGGVAQTAGGSASTFTLLENGAGDAIRNRVDFTNVYAVGSLTVTKAVTGAGAAYGDGVFTVHVTCTRSTATPTTVWSDDLVFSTGTTLTATIDDIAAGASCAITESTANAAGATAITLPTNATIPTAGNIARTVTNRFDLATLVVSKQVATNAVDADGDPVYPAGDFAAAVSCTFQGDAVYATGYGPGTPMAFALRHGDSVALAGLPAGAICTVEETEDQGADSTDIRVAIAGTTVSTAGTSATTGALAADGSGAAARNSATIVNRYGVSSFTIAKSEIGGAAAQFGAPTVTAHLTCVTGDGVTAYDGDVSVPANGSTTVDNLADGSTCDVAEVDPAGTGADAWRILDAASNPIDGTGIAITASAPGRVTLENSYLTGAVTVTKTLVGAAAAQYGVGPFLVSLLCERDGQTIVLPGGPSRSLTPAAPTVTFTGIASGAACRLVEVDGAGASSSRILDEGGAELVDDAGTGVTFTVTVDPTSGDDQTQPGYTIENRFEPAGLTVTKAVQSSALDAAGRPLDYGVFPVSVVCTFEGAEVFATGFDLAHPMGASLGDGDALALGGLPAGAECAVTETTPRGAQVSTVATVGGVATSATGASRTVVLSDAVSGDTVALTNRYDEGALQLTKAVTGSGASAWGDQPFTIDVVCTDTLAGLGTVYEREFTLHRGDAPVTLEHLAASASCAVTETATGGATSTSIDVGGTVTAGTSATAAVPAADTVDVTVDNVFDTTQVAVEKTLTGDGVALYGAGPFEVTLDCTRDVDGATLPVAIPGGATRTLEGASGFRASFDGLPRGAECTVDETRTGGANGTTLSADSLTLASAVEPVTIENEFVTTGLVVTGEVEGPGAPLYGNGPFQVTLTCTRDVDGVDVPIDVPGGAERELSGGAGMTTTYDDLPVGAECWVTETRMAGANAVGWEGSMTPVGRGATPLSSATPWVSDTFSLTPSTVTLRTVTNQFGLGAVTVAKSIGGSLADAHRADVFSSSLACTRQVDGATEVVAVPGGATRDFGVGDTIEYPDLPQGADCSFAETRDGGASLRVLTSGILPASWQMTVADGATDYQLANMYLSLAETGVSAGLVAMLAGLLLTVGAAAAGRGRRGAGGRHVMGR